MAFECIKGSLYTTIKHYGASINYEASYDVTEPSAGLITITNPSGVVEIFEAPIADFVDGSNVALGTTLVELIAALEPLPINKTSTIKTPYNVVYIVITSGHSTLNPVGLRGLDFYYEGELVKVDPNWALSTTNNVMAGSSLWYLFSHEHSRLGRSSDGAGISFDMPPNVDAMITVDTRNGEPLLFDEIRYVNEHWEGRDTDWGVKDVFLFGSTDDEVEQTVGDVISNQTSLWTGEFAEHVDEDILDEQAIVGLEGWHEIDVTDCVLRENESEILSEHKHAPATKGYVKRALGKTVTEKDAAVLMAADFEVGDNITVTNEAGEIVRKMTNTGSGFASAMRSVVAIDTGSSSFVRTATEGVIFTPSEAMAGNRVNITVPDNVNFFTLHDMYGRLSGATGGGTLRVTTPESATADAATVDVKAKHAHVELHRKKDNSGWTLYDVSSGEASDLVGFTTYMGQLPSTAALKIYRVSSQGSWMPTTSDTALRVMPDAGWYYLEWMVQVESNASENRGVIYFNGGGLKSQKDDGNGSYSSALTGTAISVSPLTWQEEKIDRRAQGSLTMYLDGTELKIWSFVDDRLSYVNQFVFTRFALPNGNDLG